MISSGVHRLGREGTLGKRSAQRRLFEADHLYLDHVGRDSFYGFLASQRGRMFRDQDFAMLYCPDNGRNSVPLSLFATTLVLQGHEGASDEEAKARGDFDVRWKVALGVGIEDRPFARSTFPLFRAQLILHEGVRAIFEKSLGLARESGAISPPVLNPTPVIARGRSACSTPCRWILHWRGRNPTRGTPD